MVEVAQALEYPNFVQRFRVHNCYKYIPNNNEVRCVRCVCGVLQGDHSDDPDIPRRGRWSPTYLKQEPTNTFGEVTFIPLNKLWSKPAKYLRLSNDSNPSDVYELLFKYWKLKEAEPQCMISLIGGLSDFQQNVGKEKLLEVGLAFVKAIKATNAIVITNGVDETLGELIRLSQSPIWSKSDSFDLRYSIQTIGVLPWKNVQERSALINQNGQPKSAKQINQPAQPNISDEPDQSDLPVRPNQPKNASYNGVFVRRTRSKLVLNRYHTHFLLVDDGEYSSNASEKTEEFRVALEKRIAEEIHDRRNIVESHSNDATVAPAVDNNVKKQGLPPLCILINGGIEAIDQVRKRVQNKIPVILCKGTGGAADFLADVVAMFGTANRSRKRITAHFTANFTQQLLSKICDFLSSKCKQRHNAVVMTRANRLMPVIEDICDQSEIYIFDAAQNELSLDSAIFMCLLREVGRARSLQYCLKWNSLELAEKTVFNSDKSMAASSIAYCDYFVQALIGGKLEFVRLFIEHGLNLYAYFKGEHLTTLVGTLLRKDGTKMYLADIYFGDIAENMTESSTMQSRRTEPTGKNKNHLQLSSLNQLLNGLSHRFEHSIYIKPRPDNETFEDPFEELCIWSIMALKPDFALYFWDQCAEPVQTAIIGTYICHLLVSSSSEWSTTMGKNLTKLKHDLETLAIEMICAAFSKDIHEATRILNRKSSNWCGTSCIELAALAGDKAFVATDACQHVIWDTWNGEPSKETDSSTMQTPVSVKTHTNPKTYGSTAIPAHSEHETKPFAEDGEAAERNDHTQHIPSVDVGTNNRNGDRSSWCSITTIFHISPRKKFKYHQIHYIIYIIHYAYVLLFSFRPAITGAEIALQVWTFSNLLEEIFRIFTHPGRWKGWWNYSSILAFSRIQFFSIATTCLGLALRFMYPYTFSLARLIMAIGFVLCMSRLLKIYFLSNKLGPKVIMIRKMTLDLAMFMAILVVMLLSYTIVSRSLIYPDRNFFGGVFGELFYHGIWVLFGELQDELSQVTFADCFGQNNTIGAFQMFDCWVQHWPPPIFLAIYCFLGTVLLINLLTAAFSDIFQEVQKDSDQLWRYYMFFMVEEYEKKSWLPTPLCFLQYAYEFYRSREARRQTLARSETSEYSVVFENTIRSEVLDKTEVRNEENPAAKIMNKINRSDSKIRTRDDNRDFNRDFNKFNSGLQLANVGRQQAAKTQNVQQPTVDASTRNPSRNLPGPSSSINAPEVIDNGSGDKKYNERNHSLDAEDKVDIATANKSIPHAEDAVNEAAATNVMRDDPSVAGRSEADDGDNEYQPEKVEERQGGEIEEEVVVADETTQRQETIAEKDYGHLLSATLENMTDEERKLVFPAILSEIKAALGQLIGLDHSERPDRYGAYGRLVNSLLEMLPTENAHQLRLAIANICEVGRDSKHVQGTKEGE